MAVSGAWPGSAMGARSGSAWGVARAHAQGTRRRVHRWKKAPQRVGPRASEREREKAAGLGQFNRYG
jgi:hypothetical protein